MTKQDELDQAMNYLDELDVVGVDGCRAGWFSVRLPHRDNFEVAIFPTFRELIDRHEDAGLILVDIPIGLPEGPGGRDCDRESRRLLGARSSSVFPTPTRQTVHQAASAPHDYAAALGMERGVAGKGISKQAFAIAPKIAEVDSVMLSRTKNMNPEIREVHPELCFWGLNYTKPIEFSKKTPQGEDERVRILRRLEPRTDLIVAEATKKFLRKDVGQDDILDAIAAAVTGFRDQGMLLKLPMSNARDNKGLAMEMVYWA